jgi:hypothetical protein
MRLRGIKTVIMPEAAALACHGQTITIDGKEFLAAPAGSARSILLLPLAKPREKESDKAAE